MSAAAEVHMCISGDGEFDEEAGEEEKYDYDYGGMELIMDDEKAKVGVYYEYIPCCCIWIALLLD